MTTHFEDAWSDVIGKGWREGREQRVSDRKRDAAASMQRAAANRRYQRTATSSPPERKRRTVTRRQKPQPTEEETWGRPEDDTSTADMSGTDFSALSGDSKPSQDMYRPPEPGEERKTPSWEDLSANREKQPLDLGEVPTPAAPIEKPKETLGSRMEDQSEDAFPTNYTNLSSEDREEVNAKMGSNLNTFNDGSKRYEQASERGDITPEQAKSAKEDYQDYLFEDSPWQPSGKTESADTTPSLDESKAALSPSPAAEAGFEAMKPQEPEPQPEPQPEPPRIETPASEIVEPTEEVVDAVNAPKDLGPDMKRLPADPTGKFERDAINDEIGSQETNEPDEIDEWKKLRSKNPKSDEVQPPSKEDNANELSNRVQNAKALREGREPEHEVNDSALDERGRKAAEMFEQVQAKKRKRMGEGGQGGQTFASVTNSKPADPPTSKPQTITASSSTEDVMNLIDRIHDGDASAKSALYNSMGDVEEHHPDEFVLAQEAVSGFSPAADDLAKPLTDAKTTTNDAMAAALLNRDGKKKR